MAPIVLRRGVVTMPQCRCRASAPLAVGQAVALRAAWRILFRRRRRVLEKTSDTLYQEIVRHAGELSRPRLIYLIKFANGA
jgi:hypothetical protein